MRMYKVHILALALLGMHSMDYDARAQMGSLSIPSVGESAVVIVNRGNARIFFSIRPSDGVWAEYAIESGHNMRIACNQCFSELFQILVNTEGREVRYDLRSGSRYAIEWNNRGEIWDVFRIPE